MLISNEIKVIAFDADDTLWVNLPLFYALEEEYIELMRPYVSEKEARDALFQTEVGNMEIYGYGVKPFVLSVIETAIRLSNNRIKPQAIERVIQLGKNILEAPIELLPGVKECLDYFLATNYRLVLATKGDALDQERKLKDSGLSRYFEHVEVMSDKQTSNYLDLFKKLKIEPQNFFMIGNSLKSDVLPVVNLGGEAIHIPFHSTWEYESADENQDTIKAYNSLFEFLECLNR